MAPTFDRRTTAVLGSVVILGGIIAIAVAHWLERSNPGLANHTREAVVTLVLVAILGGLAKLLVDDIGRLRAQRAEDARFVQAVLDDVKLVYDRLERARLLIAAHQSGTKFGEEMRALVDGRVSLVNVDRALQTPASCIDECVRSTLRFEIGNMTDFLEDITNEYARSYAEIAYKQRIYEATVDAEARSAPSSSNNAPPANPAWEEIRSSRCTRRSSDRRPTAPGLLASMSCVSKNHSTVPAAFSEASSQRLLLGGERISEGKVSVMDTKVSVMDTRSSPAIP